MEKNYASHSGAFMALAKLMAEAVRELDAAKDSYDRNWAMSRLMMLAEQTEDTLVELGYVEKEVDTA